MKAKLFGAAIALVLTVPLSRASADVVEVDFSGTVTQSFGFYTGFGCDNIFSGCVLAPGTPYDTQRQLRGRCPRSHRGCRTARPDLGERWSSRLVATATLF
jgi:hypothetical protein